MNRRPYTYFIQIKLMDFVKIGKSDWPLTRMKVIQSCIPFELELIGATKKWKERDVHKKFSSLRIKNEWFKLNTRLLNFIKKESIKL